MDFDYLMAGHVTESSQLPGQIAQRGLDLLPPVQPERTEFAE